MLDAPPHKGRRKSEALPPEGSRNFDAMAQRNPSPTGCDEKCRARHCDGVGPKVETPSQVDLKGVAGHIHEALQQEVEHESGATPQGKAEH
jgi:hypothetical protein